MVEEAKDLIAFEPLEGKQLPLETDHTHRNIKGRTLTASNDEA